MQINKDYHPELKRFIKDLKKIVEGGETEEIITQAVAERLKVLLKHENILPDNLKQPNPDHYVMYPVYVSPDNSFSIASAVWDVNQSTPPHDHGTWGVIGIVEGTEHEISYIPNKENKQITRGKDYLHHAQSVTICCTSDQDLHEVSCASNIPCVGLHIYGGNIGQIKRNSYNKKTGEITTFISEWAVPN